ncbi:MAG: Unknown protein [uncultured Sulfurovum sp.]|uniref:Uncharacterized protein n=1 Tax=uncultured Sulfurovum sp. TaxID=269237 RepID=A0A6S6T7X4_9BACT|nr:MAG: Unknown protein [uncultured Sulfurovum sp.]
MGLRVWGLRFKMQKNLFFLILTTLFLKAGVVVPDDYFVAEEKELSYIYADEHASLMPNMKAYQEEIMDGYEKEYGFKLDDELSVGLASSNNQIANGFSTQVPNNMQIFYGAGASYIDYFSSTSWLKTLVIHETAHNFQLNPKENFLSKNSHKILGNTPVSFLGFLPLFPLPNVLENSFILEGNAVMNESRFGNGGRLFSGYALAEVVALAKAGEITPALMVNPTLTFPYGEKFYLVGGFFHQFLLERYGIEKLNGYFKTYASQAFPFFSNAIFKEQYGKTFEVLLAEFVEEVKQKHVAFQVTKGQVLLHSQIFVPLNRDGDEIYTLVGDNKSASKVFSLNRAKMMSNFKQGSWRVGEVFKRDAKYYSQASAKTSPVTIEMGLFDKEGYLQKGFEGKAVQGFTASGKEVYFDVPQSIETPQVYVDGVFYTQAHSSVHVNQEDLYYFKQVEKKRTLYKNKTALVSFEGHYGFVVDVDKEGLVYFIASSEHGSTAYRLNAGEIERVTLADDVIDLKLINNTEALVVSIDAKGYAYRKIKLEKHKGLSHRKDLPQQSGFLSKGLAEKAFLSAKEPLKAKEYNAFKALKYSSLNQALTYGEYTGWGIDLQANLADPLLQNSLALVLSHNDERDVAGLRYESQVHQLEYGAAFYGVYKKNEFRTQDKRDVGYDAYLRLPFLASGYWKGDSVLAYTKDYDNIYREPLTLSFNISNGKQFGFSKYANSLNALSFFGSSDREASMFGGTYAFKQDLPWQSYVGAKATYMKSDEVNVYEEKGIELREGFSSLQSDKATVNVPSFSSTTYAQEVKMAEFSLAKVFDASYYFYSFPLSLQRESLYVKQRIYDIDFSNTLQKTYYERILGTELDLVLLNKLEFPLRLEWVHNKDVRDKDKLKVLVGVNF